MASLLLFILCIEYMLNLIADILNIKQVRTDLPKEFIGLYETENYAKSQEYLKVNTQFSIMVYTINFIVILAFWFCKGFAWIDTIVRSFELNVIITGLLYVGILCLLKGIMSLPFDIYETFVIEERFGFNKTTWRTYILDLFKGTLLGIIIGGILLSALLFFFEYAGKYAWIWCWIVISCISLVLQWIIPTWILPLFYRFKLLEPGELRDAIFAYANRIQFSLENVFVMDGSRRSTKANAFFTGFGKHKRIVLFDTLIEKHTISHLLAVLAHEMGHFKKGHLIQQIVIQLIHLGIMLALLGYFISNQSLFSAFYMEHISVYAGLLFFSILYTPVDFLMNIGLQMLSRKNEYEADRFAITTTNDPTSLLEALKQLHVENLSNLFPHPFYVLLHYSHPPILERLKAIERSAVIYQH
ncbi:MAG: M48 family metallopeptidase [Desulfobacterales bacterium]|nr:M48 family metallopeptidase [Desulfobacterales bacterium]